MNAIDTFTQDGWSVTLYFDEEGGSCDPRDNDNVGTLACSHKRYTLGNKHASFTASDYDGWNGVRDMLTESHGPLALMEPVYMLDHSGIALSLTAFNDAWDSGQVGWCYVSVEKMQAEYGTDWKDHLTQARACITAELEEYSQWLNGEVYGYVVRDPQGDEQDSCWGFIGMKWAKQEAKCALEACIKVHVRNELQLAELLNRGFAL